MTFLSNTHSSSLHRGGARAAEDFFAHPLPPPALPTEHIRDIAAAAPGRVLLDSGLLRELRLTRLMSQQDLADDCWRRNIQVSIATIKRAEAGRAVRFRIARELARYFEVQTTSILRRIDGLAAQ